MSRVFLYLGVLASMAGTPDASAASIKAALPLLRITDYAQGDNTVSENKASYLNDRAMKYYEAKRYNEAIEKLNQAIALEPNFANAYDNRATCLTGKTKFEDALADYTKAISFHTSDEKYFLCNRAQCRTQLHDLNGARADLDHAISLDPKLVPGYRFRTWVRKDQGDLQGAIADMSEVIALDPSPQADYVARSKLKAAMGDAAGAAADENKAKSLGWKPEDYYAQRGNFDLSNDNRAGAYEDYAQAIAAKPRFYYPYRNLAALYFQEGDLDQAMAACQQGLAAFPEAAPLYLARADVEIGQGRFPEADADITKSLSLSPGSDNYLAYGDRGFLLETEGNFKEARQSLNKAIFNSPFDGRLYYWLANIELAEGDLDRALTDYHVASRAWRLGYYSHFFIWVIQVRRHGQAVANSELASFTARQPHYDHSVWAGIIGQFLLGKVDEKTLMSEAVSPKAYLNRIQHCEAWYYAGIKRWFAGDKAAAKADFQQCLATKDFGRSEYVLSKYQLQSGQ